MQRLPVSISLGLWSTLLIYLDLHPARHPQGGARRQPLRRWPARAVVLVGYAVPGFLFAILLVVLFAGGSFFHGSRCAA